MKYWNNSIDLADFLTSKASWELIQSPMGYQLFRPLGVWV